MLSITEKYRDELRRGPDVVDVAERLAVPLNEAAIESLLAHFEENSWPPFKPHSYAWDLRRQLGEDGEDVYDNAVITLGDEADKLWAEGHLFVGPRCPWSSFDRARIASDRLLIDRMDDATFERWTAPPEIAAALERLRDIADANRAAEDAAHEAQHQARCDAIHAEWIAEGSPDESLSDFERATITYKMRADDYQEASAKVAHCAEALIKFPAYQKNAGDPGGAARTDARRLAHLDELEGDASVAKLRLDLAKLRKDRLKTNEAVIVIPKLSLVPQGVSMMLPRGDVEFIPSDADEFLVAQFTKKHADNLRYVASWGRWLEWDGRRWRFDDTLLAFDLARAVCRDVANVINPTIASRIASAKTVAAVERMAKADRLIAATIDQWDANPWLLNTPGGVVDLQTGKLRPSEADDYMTKITAIAPGGECPTWLAFLQRVTNGDAELIAFLQSALGYGLTGVTREHAMFFLYGTGANGKSVLLSTVAGILGHYHTTAPIETFTASATERHPTDLAGLRGARLVTATETEEGRRWAEAKIKALTGGDKIAARFMRQDFFEFVPSFKLMIAGNHKPGLRSVDEAIRRRIHLVPFTVTIPPAERDHTLADKLKAEWPGILAWMIEGCRRWQAEGLHAPAAVQRATAAYLEAEDALGAWIDERCERDATAWTSREQLFGSWSTWATAAGEFVGSSRKFLSALETRGMEDARQNNRRGFRGLKLRTIPVQPIQFPPRLPTA